MLPGLQSEAMKIFPLHRIRLSTAATAAAALFALTTHATTPTEQEVLAPIIAMFAGMTHRDAQAITAQTMPKGSMILMRDGKPDQMTFEDFAARVGKPSKAQIEERIHDPLIRIDNDLAVVWAPFVFLVNGKVDHCGTDLFNLIHVDGHWLIASVADTGRKTCDADPLAAQPTAQPAAN